MKEPNSYFVSGRKKYKKYDPGSPDIDNVDENVIVVRVIERTKPRNKSTAVSLLLDLHSGFIFCKYKSTITYTCNLILTHPKKAILFNV